MKIVHTEASNGWGGQEIRILREAMGMRERGHEVIFCVTKGGQLVQRARDEGFTVYEVRFEKKRAPITLVQLVRIFRREKVSLVNTHSSLDAWIGGIAAKMSGVRVIRTRHLSSKIRPGLNSRLLYNWLADRTVTTCQQIVPMIEQQANLKPGRCLSIPTGVDPKAFEGPSSDLTAFRDQWGINAEDFVVGTLCVLRSWKGIGDLLQAANRLKHIPKLKWLVVGGGPQESALRAESKRLGLDQVIFTGQIEPPAVALQAMDLFLLLSTKNEGVSQASLQAAYLEKAMVTTRVGGLPEVCIEGKTGYCVDTSAPDQVATYVEKIMQTPSLKEEMGKQAKSLVLEQFTYEKMLDQMEEIYSSR